MADRELPSPETLRQLFRYEPETGKLFWLRDGREIGTKRNIGYHQVNLSGLGLQVHRIVWAMHRGQWPANNIDHINGDPFDNRLENLRDCGQSTNCKNAKMHSNNKSGVTGVSWDPANKKWHATIRANYKTLNLGRYASLEEAATARARANVRLGFTNRHGT